MSMGPWSEGPLTADQQWKYYDEIDVTPLLTVVGMCWPSSPTISVRPIS